MLRRTGKSATALDQTKQDLAQQETQLRERVEKLERMIAEAPRVAEEISRQQREELLIRGGQADTDPLSLLNVWRNDEPRDWFTADDALRNAPRHSKDQFIVPKVME